MELKELFYFKTVVDEKSILKASKELHIAQPPLSRMMKKLESELNTTLFIRGKELKLTESGKLLYDKALTMLELESSVKNDIKELNSKQNQTINIGIVTSSTSLLYSGVLKEFSHKFPNTKFNITESNTFKLLDLLDKRLINIAITRTPFNTDLYDVIKLESEPMVLTSNSDISAYISLYNISKLKVVVYRRFYDILTKLFKKNNLKLNIIALVDDAKTAILFAKSINAHAIVPFGAYKTFSNNLYSSTILEDSLYTALTIIKRKNEVLDDIYTNFINIIKNNQ